MQQFDNINEIIHAHTHCENIPIVGGAKMIYSQASSQLWHQALDYYESIDDKDECYWFKYYLASNETLPIDVVERLSNDLHQDIRKRIADRTDLTKNIFTKLASDKSADVQSYIASNQKTPITLLLSLVDHTDANVRFSICFNDNLPIDTLYMLTKDIDLSVRDKAKEIYDERLAEQEKLGG